jgi:hypothetical protein
MSPRYVNPKLLRQDELEVPDEEPNEARWDGGPSAGV